MKVENELAEAKQTFLTESGELLEEMESALLSLENDPDNQEAINSLFRAAHTIKGSSGILGIEDVEKFTHNVENLLSRVRDGELRLTGEMAGLVLECRDHISLLVGLAADEEAVPEDAAAAGTELVKRLEEAGGISKKTVKEKAAVARESPVCEDEGRSAETDTWHISLRFGHDVLRGGMDPASFIGYLEKMGEFMTVTTLYDAMPEAGEMDPESCYLGFEIDLKTDLDKNAIEDVFEFVREDCTLHILPPHCNMAQYIELIENLPENSSRLGEILVAGGALTSSELEYALKLQGKGAPKTDEEDGAGKPLVGEIMVQEGMVHPEVVDAALEKQKKGLKAMAREASTIRIDAGKLDVLINLVGELVISSANVNQQALRLDDGTLAESTSVMLRLVEEIRDNTMQIRMVPIGDTFTRFRRVVRDTGRGLGKEIDLVITGGETELDKTIIEKISDPLMHLVRNAADHGIEIPEKRTAAGKPAKGVISLNAYHDAGSIVIEVKDDGRGLNRMGILEKAVEAGLITAGQSLSDREIFGLIFEPGFSTAEQVTKISGRGVGMDVVRQNIEALRGTVDIDSAEGKGTMVRIRLPLTMAIIEGFLVTVGESPYVIPLDMVLECVELSETDRLKSRSCGYINLRGDVLPYLRLSDFFGVKRADTPYENVVIVQFAGEKTGLVVDGLFGEVQTVIKSLGRVYRDVKGVSGATIMGDGRVALILDVPRLIQSIEDKKTMPQQRASEQPGGAPMC